MLRKFIIPLFAFVIVAFASSASADLSVATWANTSLNFNGAVAAATGTGSISRGAGVTYSNAANRYSSSNSWNSVSAAAAFTANQYIQLTVDTTGYQGIKFNWTAQHSGTGPATSQMYYSTTGTGGPFTAFGSTINMGAAAAVLQTPIDFTSVPGANNNPNFVLRIVGFGASGAGGTFSIQSFSFTATNPFFVGDYTITPSALTLTNIDGTDIASLRTATALVYTVNATTISAINVTAGSPNWAYSGTATPFTVPAGTTTSLAFTYSPIVNNGSTEVSTFTVTTAANTPASFLVKATGSTVKDTTIAALKTLIEAGTAGSFTYKVTGAVVNSNNLQSPQFVVFVQDRADGNAATRGLDIFDQLGTGKAGTGGTIPAVGDTLTIYGTTTSFQGNAEIIPTRGYVRTGTGASITPVTVTTAQVNSDTYEGVLVQEPTIKLNAGSYVSTTSAVDIVGFDGATSVSVRLAANIAPTISYTADGTSIFPVTGVVVQTDATNPLTGGTGYKLEPRFANEVPVELSEFKLD